MVELKITSEENPMCLHGLDQLRTGDVIMCHGSAGDSPIDRVIEDATHSPWEHTGIIVRDPWWFGHAVRGVFILQSGSGPNGYPDIIDGARAGVTLNHIGDFLANRTEIYVMRLDGEAWSDETRSAFAQAFAEAHGKPYDKNWCRWACVGIGSYFRCRCWSSRVVPRQTNEFWCSALVAFMFVKSGWLPDETDWTAQTPADIAGWQLENGLSLSRPVQIK